MKYNVVSFSVSASEPKTPEKGATEWLVQNKKTTKVHLITLVCTPKLDGGLLTNEFGFGEDAKLGFLEWVKENSGTLMFLHVAIFYEKTEEVVQGKESSGRQHSEAEAVLASASADYL